MNSKVLSTILTVCLTIAALFPALAEPTGFDQRYCYTITNVKTTGGLVPSGWGANGDINIVQWDLSSPPNDWRKTSADWLLVPTSERSDEYYIVNANLGTCLMPSGNGRENNIVIWGLQRISAQNARYGAWRFTKRGGGYIIVNAMTNKALVPTGGTQPPVVQWPLDSNTAFEWRVNQKTRIKNSDYMVTKPADPAKAYPLPSNCLMTSHSLADRVTSERILVGSALIPFWSVTDSRVSQSPADLVKESPYYILKREAYWKRVHFQHFSGGVSTEKTKKVSVGTSNETEVNEKLGLTITAAASVEYGPISGSLESTLSKELNVTRRSRTESNFEVEVGKKYDPAQGRRTVAYWMRVDEYTLYVPGDEANPILQYTWVDPSEWEDGWPKE